MHAILGISVHIKSRVSTSVTNFSRGGKGLDLL